MEKKEAETVEQDKKTEKKAVEKKAVEKKVVEKTAAEKIWEEIRSVELQMFSLPGQTVEAHCSPVTVEPSKLYLTSKVGSVVPALEDTLGKKYNIELAQKYIVVSKK